MVTGAAGMVGSYAREAFTADECIETGRSECALLLDVRDTDAVNIAVHRVRPDVVLHLAALTDVDYCELNPDEAYRTNASGTRNVALACRLRDVPLVYISTSVVFAGDRRQPYAETDQLEPVNMHGHSKLAGERFVSGLVRRHIIVRTTWLMGGGCRDKKFVGVLARKIACATSPLQVVDDRVGSPTYAKDLLRAIRALVHSHLYGVYHVVNAGACSRFELAVALRDIMRRRDVDIQPVPSSGFPLTAPRADWEVLAISKLEAAGIAMRPWHDALREYYERELGPSLACL